MNRAVEIFEVLAAMANHWARERHPRSRRDLHRPGSKELVVWFHALKLAPARQRRYNGRKDFSAGADSTRLF